MPLQKGKHNGKLLDITIKTDLFLSYKFQYYIQPYSMKRILVLLFFFLSFVPNNQAQTSASVNLEETGIWSGLYLYVRINDKLGYYAEHHYRVRNALDNITSFVGRPRQIYNRVGLSVLFNKNFEMVVGPALIVNYSPDPGNPAYEAYTIEPRIWSQFLFKFPYIGRVKLVNQFRFEPRWKKENDIGASYEFTIRYRSKFFAYIPINTRRIEVNTLYFSPSLEIFMHSGKSIVFNPFEDFRTYNGFGYVLNPKITFFAGHMWTLGQKASGYEYRTSHIFRFNIFVSLDGRKSENKVPKINMGY